MGDSLTNLGFFVIKNRRSKNLMKKTRSWERAKRWRHRFAPHITPKQQSLASCLCLRIKFSFFIPFNWHFVYFILH